ncbi:MAG: PfkB family carbohydrate kinase [Candidatus Limnocylindrales bacterium]
MVVGSASRDVTSEDPRGWRLGGGATYGALALARLGLRTAALIGTDAQSAAAWELDLLRDAGVELVLVGLSHAPVFENRELLGTRVQTCLDPGQPLAVEHLPATWRGARAWLLAPVAGELPDGWAGVPEPEACVAFGWQGILRQLAAGQPVRPLPPGPSPLLRRADVVGVSRHDLLHELPIPALCGWLGADDDLLLTCGDAGGLLITLGEHRIRRLVRYPPVPAQVHEDATGAGDVMLAALLAARTAGGAPARTGRHDLRLAAAAASLVVERSGLLGVPSLAQVRERLAGRA